MRAASTTPAWSDVQSGGALVGCVMAVLSWIAVGCQRAIDQAGDIDSLLARAVHDLMAAACAAGDDQRTPPARTAGSRSACAIVMETS